MKYNIKDLPDVFSARGNRGIGSAKLIMNIKGTIRGNKYYAKENGLEDMHTAKMKAKKINNNIIVAIAFFEAVKEKDSKEKDVFTLSRYEDNDKKLKSFTLSGNSIFRGLGLKVDDVMKDTIELKPEIQEFEGQRYFVFEIPLKK